MILFLNILQDSSFSNQITLIFHIQGVFNLPGRGFRQHITLTSSVPVTLNHVIVYVRQFIITLISFDGGSSFPDPDGFFDVPDSSVGLCISIFSCCLHSFCVPPVVFLVFFLSPQCTQHHSSCMVFGT